ncbi:MFS general substrate transporter [Aureobasidium subglaciale]|nr:MFS general substrate transporter [Aureobasidium subglaciale]
MAHILRSSTIGELVRLATSKRWKIYAGHSEDETHQYSFNASHSSSEEKDPCEDDHSTAQAQNSTSLFPDSSKATGHRIIVDWYSEDDAANPLNWSTPWRVTVNMQIGLYTFAVYMSSSIFTETEPFVENIFGISQTVAALGLAIYVLGYGIGPMLLSPLSETPAVGRNPPYVISLSIFLILSIPTALVNNVPGLLVYAFCKASLVLLAWLLGVLLVSAEDWHWSLWEILWLAVPTWIIMPPPQLFLPETSQGNILHRRAQRLRALTNNPAYMAQSEIDQEQVSTLSIVYEALVIPWKVNALDPSVLFTTIYIALLYAILYSFFEVFPIVYFGLVFLSVLIAVLLAAIPYFAHVHLVINARIKANMSVSPESRLVPALGASILNCAGLFVFGWTSRKDIHWVVHDLLQVLSSGVRVLIPRSTNYKSRITRSSSLHTSTPQKKNKPPSPSPSTPKMKVNRAAWYTSKLAKPFKVDVAPFPKATPTEVIIKNQAVAINPIDWKVQDGVFDYGKAFPYILGKDVASIVEAAGSEVKHVKKGDRVIGPETNKLVSLLPVPDAPKDVNITFTRATSIMSDAHKHVGEAIWGEYVPAALIEGKLKAVPKPMVIGKGLEVI